jgi:hypothetical protein
MYKGIINQVKLARRTPVFNCVFPQQKLLCRVIAENGTFIPAFNTVVKKGSYSQVHKKYFFFFFLTF